MKFIPIKDVSFDNTTTLAMGEAFDHACMSLRRFRTLITARELIAKRIIAAAKNGERVRVRIMNARCLVSDLLTKKGDRLGNRKIRSVTPLGADKIYERIIAGPRGERLRQGEKAVALCRRAWRVVHRLHPNEFDRLVPNPWDGVTRKRRVKKTKPAVTREEVYAFAWGCIEHGNPEACRRRGNLL